VEIQTLGLGPEAKTVQDAAQKMLQIVGNGSQATVYLRSDGHPAVRFSSENVETDLELIFPKGTPLA
jgi:hypothetical protein